MFDLENSDKDKLDYQELHSSAILKLFGALSMNIQEFAGISPPEPSRARKSIPKPASIAHNKILNQRPSEYMFLFALRPLLYMPIPSDLQYHLATLVARFRVPIVSLHP